MYNRRRRLRLSIEITACKKTSNGPPRDIARLRTEFNLYFFHEEFSMIVTYEYVHDGWLNYQL